jgi:hypothetical protein
MMEYTMRRKRTRSATCPSARIESMSVTTMTLRPRRRLRVRSGRNTRTMRTAE